MKVLTIMIVFALWPLAAFPKYRLFYIHNDLAASLNRHTAISKYASEAIGGEVEMRDGVFSSLDLLKSVKDLSDEAKYRGVDKYIILGPLNSGGCLIVRSYLKNAGVPFIPMCLTERFKNNDFMVNYKMDFKPMIDKIALAGVKLAAITPEDDIITREFMDKLEGRIGPVETFYTNDKNLIEIKNKYDRLLLVINDEKAWMDISNQAEELFEGLKELYVVFPPSKDMRDYFRELTKKFKIKVSVHRVFNENPKYGFWENLAYVFYGKFNGIGDCENDECVKEIISKNKNIDMNGLLTIAVDENK